VIRPKNSIEMNILDRDENKLQEIYDLGVMEAEKVLKDLKTYLK